MLQLSCFIMIFFLFFPLNMGLFANRRPYAWYYGKKKNHNNTDQSVRSPAVQLFPVIQQLHFAQ